MLGFDLDFLFFLLGTTSHIRLVLTDQAECQCFTNLVAQLRWRSIDMYGTATCNYILMGLVFHKSSSH